MNPYDLTEDQLKELNEATEVWHQLYYHACNRFLIALDVLINYRGELHTVSLHKDNSILKKSYWNYQATHSRYNNAIKNCKKCLSEIDELSLKHGTFPGALTGPALTNFIFSFINEPAKIYVFRAKLHPDTHMDPSSPHTNLYDLETWWQQLKNTN